MRLDRLDLTRYGKFTDTVLDFGTAKPGSPDLTLVYGLNEAGKSTAFSAFLDLLYGIPERSDYGFLHALNALQVGASLSFDGETHALVRLKKRGASLVDGEGRPVAEALLTGALGGISREAYRTMFSLDDQSLREGGKSILHSEGDLGSLLFSASSGLADLGRVLATINEEAETLHKHRVQKTELARLKRELAQLKERRTEIDTQALAFSRLAEGARQAETAFRETETALAEARAEEASLSRLLSALPLARELTRLREALEPLAGLPRVPRALMEGLPLLIRDETRLETAMQGLRSRLAALDEALDGTAETPDEGLPATRFEALQDLRARYRTALSDLPRRRQTLAAEEASLEMTLRTLGKSGHADPASLVMAAPLMARIRDLIAGKSGIDTALSQSGKELERAEEALARLIQEKQALGPAVPASRVERLAAALEALSGRTDAGRLDREERDANRLARELDGLMATLGRLIDGPDALPGLVLPDRRQFDGWREQAVRLTARKTRHLDAIDALRERINASEDRLSAIRDGALPDDEAALAIRAERDSLWQAHRAALSDATAARFEMALRKDDAAGEARLARAAELAEAREIRRAIGRDRSAIRREEEALAALDAEEAAERSRIASLLPDGLLRNDLPLAEALSLAVATVERLSEARLTRAALVEARERVADLKREGQEALSRLAQALTEAGEESADADDPQALKARAETLLDQWRTRTSDAERIARREGELRAEIDGRRRDHAEASRAAEAFSDAWRQALSGTWFDPGLSMTEVRALLDALADLPARIDACEQLRQRIRTMEEDQADFAAEVNALLGLSGLRAGGDIEERDRQLSDHQAAVTRRIAEVARADTERGELTEACRALEEEWALHMARRQPVLDALSVEQLQDALGLMDGLAERDRLEERSRDLSRQLIDMLGTSTEHEAIARLDMLDRDDLERQKSRASERVSLLSDEARERFGEWTLARNRLDAVGGDGAVAALEASRTTVLLTIEELGYRYLKLKTGALAAGSALELYRERHRSGMMRRASDAFRQITRGDYAGLTARADRDRETLIGLTRDGGSKLTDAMSTGTRYQLYLALRLAGYAEIAALRPPVPFVADDIMETFDEPRSEEVFRLFGEMARIGQVIYLTHHRHLCDIARQVVPDVRIIEL